jgi:uncharacterized protein (TIGR02246 family)
MKSDQEEIRSLFSTWQKASREGDVETLRGLMAEDVVFLTAEFGPIVGRESFLEMSKAGPKPFAIEFEGELKELEIVGDWAFAWNQLVVTVTPAEGASPVRRAGDILTVLHKENGRWVLKRDANMLKGATGK